LNKPNEKGKYISTYIFESDREQLKKEENLLQEAKFEKMAGFYFTWVRNIANVFENL